MRSKITLPAIAVLLAVPLTLACMCFLDRAVALEVWQWTSAYPFLQRQFVTIPNILPGLVLVATVVMCLACRFAGRREKTYRAQRFLQLAATAVPAAFLVKVVLQDAFGRTNVRLWLRTGGPVEFRWFDPIGSGGFPSGHTLVFSAFFASVWLYYPRYRPLAVAALSALVLALLLTSYHFISDILAGGYCGILVTLALHRFFAGARTPAPR